MNQTTQPFANNRWLQIWTKPKAVVREFLDSDPDPDLHVIPIVLAVGFVQGIGLDGSFIVVWLSLMVSIPIFYFAAFLSCRVGKWYGGKGTCQDMRAALAWGSYVPSFQVTIALIPVFVFNILLGNYLTVPREIGYLALTVFSLAFGLWISITTLKTIAEAHQFSSLRAFLTQATVAATYAIPAFLFLYLTA